MQLQALCKDNACLLIMQLYQLEPTEQKMLPPPVKDLLDKYRDVFAEPRGVPPARACDHRIPLIPGAQPFSVRPYWYPPALKTEIEEQVAELLKQGIIQVSHSLFSSPVVLVRKKDLTWRSCGLPKTQCIDL